MEVPYYQGIPLYTPYYPAPKQSPSWGGGDHPNDSSSSAVMWVLIVIVILIFLILLIGGMCWYYYPSNSNDNYQGCGTCASGTAKMAVPVSGNPQSNKGNGSGGGGNGNGSGGNGNGGGGNGGNGNGGGGNGGREDPLSDPDNIEASPGLWIGSIDQKGEDADNSLYVPSYGYFYPRRINGVIVRPVVNAATADGSKLYAHVENSGLEGIYLVDTAASSPSWSLLVATGNNQSRGSVDARGVLDTCPSSRISDIYHDNGRIFMVTERSIYSIADGKVVVADDTRGVLGGDSHEGIAIYLKDDDTILKGGQSVILKGHLPRRDVSGYVKYLQNNNVFTVASRDQKGHLGYMLGPQEFSQVPSDLRALGANKRGSVGFVDENGRVMINEYDAATSDYRYRPGLPYRSTVPVEGFKVAVTVGSSKIFIFATFDSGKSDCFSVVGSEYQHQRSTSCSDGGEASVDITPDVDVSAFVVDVVGELNPSDDRGTFSTRRGSFSWRSRSSSALSSELSSGPTFGTSRVSPRNSGRAVRDGPVSAVEGRKTVQSDLFTRSDNDSEGKGDFSIEEQSSGFGDILTEGTTFSSASGDDYTFST